MEETIPVEVQGERRAATASTRKPLLRDNILSFVVGLVGIAAIGASAWVYSETQRDIGRLATDIAQLRVSMELFGRQQGTPSGTDAASLADLANRIALLEENWRSAPIASPSALPEVAAPASPAAAANAGDCLPTGTRFLVGTGDNYPICGIAGSVSIGSVDNGFISLADGTVIAAGGNIALPGTACMIGVVTASDGFAEIRVTC